MKVVVPMYVIYFVFIFVNKKLSMHLHWYIIFYKEDEMKYMTEKKYQNLS